MPLVLAAVFSFILAEKVVEILLLLVVAVSSFVLRITSCEKQVIEINFFLLVELLRTVRFFFNSPLHHYLMEHYLKLSKVHVVSGIDDI